MRVGYIRVSSVDQNTVRQLDGIEVERVFTDKASGKDPARPKLQELIAFVREGDTVLVPIASRVLLRQHHPFTGDSCSLPEL